MIFFLNSDLQKVFAGEIKDNRLRNSGMPNTQLENQYTAVAVPFMNKEQSQVAGALILYQITQSSEETQAYVKSFLWWLGLPAF